MHEFAQSADLVDWKSTPYLYASADSTPLFVMAMEDYVKRQRRHGFSSPPLGTRCATPMRSPARTIPMATVFTKHGRYGLGGELAAQHASSRNISRCARSAIRRFDVAAGGADERRIARGGRAQESRRDSRQTWSRSITIPPLTFTPSAATPTEARIAPRPSIRRWLGGLAAWLCRAPMQC